MFSSTASKVASKATENAYKLGSVATQKASEIGATVGERVCSMHEIHDFYPLFMSAMPKMSSTSNDLHSLHFTFV
jgi:hypothetical protein